MWIRRIAYRALFPIAVVLPLYVLVMRGLIGADHASDAVIALFLTPALFVMLLAFSGVVIARKSVRSAGAVSWFDLAVLGAIVADLIAYGILHWTALAALAAILVVGAFWLAAWELVTETRGRVNRFVNGLDVPPRQSSTVPPARGETIIIEPHR